MIATFLPGLRAAWRRLGVVIWLYLISWLVALPIGLAVGWLSHRYFGHSLAGAELLERGSLDLILEWVRTERPALQLLGPGAVGLGILWLGLAAFLDGAVVAAVAAEGPVRTGDFYAGGGRALGRMLRLLIPGLIFMGLVVGGAGYGLRRGLLALTKDWVDERASFGVQLLGLGVWLLIWAWAKGAHDLMKVEAVAKGEHRARYAFARGLGRAARHPAAVLATNLPFLALTLLVTMLALSLELRIARTSWFGLGLGVGLQQGVAGLRAFLGVGLTGAMVAWVRGDRGGRP